MAGDLEGHGGGVLEGLPRSGERRLVALACGYGSAVWNKWLMFRNCGCRQPVVSCGLLKCLQRTQSTRIYKKGEERTSGPGWGGAPKTSLSSPSQSQVHNVTVPQMPQYPTPTFCLHGFPPSAGQAAPYPELMQKNSYPGMRCLHMFFSFSLLSKMVLSAGRRVHIGGGGGNRASSRGPE